MSEQFLEIIVEQLRLVGQNRQRRVRAHGTDGLDTILRHRSDVDAQVFEVVTERLQALKRRLMIRLWLFFLDVGQIGKAHDVLFQPFAVRLGRCHLLLDFFVADDASFAGVDEKHSARLKAALFQDPLRRHVEHAHLGSHDDEIVLGHVVTRRP